jgi:acetylglutamate kinase
MQAPILIKVSGHELDDPAYLDSFAAVIQGLSAPAIIVHGGGAEISALQKQFGIEPRYADGLRITDADSLRVVEMILCGTVNKRLVRVLTNAGLDALGLSGVDRGLVRAEQMPHPTQDMGYTGKIVSVRGAVIAELLAQGVTPVIAPVCAGIQHNFNVNADHVAGAIAGAVGAARLVFLTNVEGVLVNGAVVPSLTPAQTQALIQDGTIFGGMIPKVQTALGALTGGAQRAVITNLVGLQAGGGTVFSA